MSQAQQYEGIGEFEKILKRMYRLAGFAGIRLLRRRATKDVLRAPDSATFVFSYMRCSGSVSEYLTWAENLLSHDEQIYPDVNVSLFESLLRLEAGPADARRIRQIAVGVLNKSMTIPGAAECAAIAPLLILRFGDRRSLPLLRQYFDDDNLTVSQPLLRSAALTFCSFGSNEFREVRRAASRRLMNHLADVVRLVEKIRGFTTVPDRYKARLEARYDPMSQTVYVDMRSLLTVRLLQLAKNKAVSSWVTQWKSTMSSKGVSAYDQQLLKRLA